MVGTRLKHYDLVAQIGQGGMGVVYRGYDTRLNRHVAIKVIRPDVLLDADRRGRFLREARTVSAFNHPGIVVIHDVDTDCDPPFLAMELVEGEPLDRRLARGALPLREGLDYGVQIADALAHAHASDVVHRDMKPANVIVTRDNRVKVLDFGLAKPIGPPAFSGPASDANTRTRVDVDTIPGTVVGTVAYMSPEQAEGAPVDARSDIFSFGALLYEMFSGRRAFPSGSVSSTLAAILRDDPAPLRQVAPSVPRELERVVHRCLRKEPALRFQTAADLKLMLADLHQDLDSGALAAPVPAKRPRSSWVWRVSVGALLAAAGVVGGLIAANRTNPAPAALPPEMSLEPLTLDGGLTAMPTLSRDGRLMAYASDRGNGNNLDIWVQQLAGGDPLALTDDPSDDHSPDFSPDGAQVAFRSERDGGGIYVVPALGGTPRLIAREGRRPRFSPDSSRLAYWTGQFRGSASDLASATYVVPLAGGESIRVAPEFVVARDPLWAPDGRALMIFGRRDWDSPLADALDWWWVPLDGSPPARTGAAARLPAGTLRTASTREWGSDGVPAGWTEDGIAFSDGANLWTLPVSATEGRATGSPRRQTFGPGRHSGPTLDRNGHVVFAAIAAERVVERVSVEADSADANPTVLHSDGADSRRTSQTRDGLILVFERQLAGQQEVWLKDLRSGRQRIVVRVNSPAQVSATISPDGARIAYTSDEGADLGGSIFTGTGYFVDAVEGVPKVVCTSCALAGFLSDNRRVLAMTAGRDNVIRTIDVLSGASFDLVEKSGGRLTRPHASPDDRVLAFRSADERNLKSYVVPLSPGHPAPRAAWQQVEEPTTTGRPCGWSPDSTILYLLLDTDGFRCLWAQRVNPRTGRLVGRPYVARHLHNAEGPSTSFGNAITRDGFMYDLSRARGNLWRLARAGATPPE